MFREFAIKIILLKIQYFTPTKIFSSWQPLQYQISWNFIRELYQFFVKLPSIEQGFLLENGNFFLLNFVIFNFAKYVANDKNKFCKFNLNSAKTFAYPGHMFQFRVVYLHVKLNGKKPQVFFLIQFLSQFPIQAPCVYFFLLLTLKFTCFDPWQNFCRSNSGYSSFSRAFSQRLFCFSEDQTIILINKLINYIINMILCQLYAVVLCKLLLHFVF